MSKILITTSSFNTDTPEIRALEEMGYEIMLNPHGRRLTESEVKELLTPDITAMIAGVEPLTRDVIMGAENLRAISRCGIGMDSVDQDAVKERNITLTNTPDAPTKAVAELTIGLMLDCLRQVPLQDRAMRVQDWVRPMGGLLGVRTIGLIGFGRIGKKVAEYAMAFGAQINAYDPYAQDTMNGAVTHIPFNNLLEKSDIVSLHIPFTEGNKHIIDEAAIKRMKNDAILINASRGGLVDEVALAHALKKGELASAALDVYENEPYTGSLVQLDNIVLSAHVGSYAKESRAEQETLAAANLVECLSPLSKRA